MRRRIASAPLRSFLLRSWFLKFILYYWDHSLSACACFVARFSPPWINVPKLNVTNKRTFSPAAFVKILVATIVSSESNFIFDLRFSKFISTTRCFLLEIPYVQDRLIYSAFRCFAPGAVQIASCIADHASTSTNSSANHLVGSDIFRFSFPIFQPLLFLAALSCRRGNMSIFPALIYCGICLRRCPPASLILYRAVKLPTTLILHCTVYGTVWAHFHFGGSPKKRIFILKKKKLKKEGG